MGAFTDLWSLCFYLPFANFLFFVALHFPKSYSFPCNLYTTLIDSGGFHPIAFPGALHSARAYCIHSNIFPGLNLGQVLDLNKKLPYCVQREAIIVQLWNLVNKLG